jgi:MacB-like periplasmic core domain
MRLEHWFYTIPLRLRSLFRRSQMDQELEDELQIHLEQQIAQEEARGKTSEAARYAALRAVGGLEQRKEECRDSRRVRWLHDLMQDAAYAVRTLAKNTGFTIVATLVLALGIGTNTAVFTIVNHVLLRPLPYPEPNRLFLISNIPKQLPFDPGPIMIDRDYLQFRQYDHLFEGLATISSASGRKMTLTKHGEPAIFTASVVGPDLLRILRVQPSLGRAFLDEGRPDPNVVLLSHRLWMSHFGGDPQAIGKAVTLDGVIYSIVGVMPETFNFQSADLWVRDQIQIAPHNVFFSQSLVDSSPVFPQRRRKRN